MFLTSGQDIGDDTITRSTRLTDLIQSGGGLKFPNIGNAAMQPIRCRMTGLSRAIGDSKMKRTGSHCDGQNQTMID